MTRWILITLLAGCGFGIHSDPSAIGKPDGGASRVTDGGGAGQCSDPEGPLHPYTQKADVDQLIVGRWLHCTGPLMLNLNELGIELTADGRYFALVDDGAGGVVRKLGFDGQGTWDTYQETAIAVQLSWHPTPSSGWGGTPEFEDSPRRFTVQVGYVGPAVYVLIP